MLKHYFKKIKNFDLIDYLHGIGWAGVIGINIWVLTMDIPQFEKAVYVFFMNIIGFFCIGLPMAYALLGTVFKDRFKRVIENIVSKAIGREIKF